MEGPVRHARVGASQPRTLLEKVPVVSIEREEREELRPEGPLRRRLALRRMPAEPARDGAVEIAGGLLDLGAILRSHEMLARVLQQSDGRCREVRVGIGGHRRQGGHPVCEGDRAAAHRRP